MDTITKSDLHALLASHAPPCISIYVPTHPVGREGENDFLRFTQLVDQAQEKVAKMGGRAVEARDFVAPLRELAEDTSLWQNRSHGLAVFFSPSLYKRFRLPLHFDSHVAVGTRFLTRPLLPLITEEDRFLLLTLSQHQVRFYEGNRYQLSLREVPELPTDLESELNLVAADQGRKQMHAAGPDPKRHHATIYHGHGGKPDSRKAELLNFFRAVDVALLPVLRNERAPLIIAGVDYELPIYRQVNTYTGLAEQELEANCDYFSEHELHERAWPIMQDVMAAKRAAQIQDIYHSADKARRQIDIQSILPASHTGRVEVLWIDQRASLYGGFDPARGKVEINPNGVSDGEDLLDLAAANTLLHRGKVYALDRDEIPDQDTIAAVLRY